MPDFRATALAAVLLAGCSAVPNGANRFQGLDFLKAPDGGATAAASPDAAGSPAAAANIAASAAAQPSASPSPTPKPAQAAGVATTAAVASPLTGTLPSLAVGATALASALLPQPNVVFGEDFAGGASRWRITAPATRKDEKADDWSVVDGDDAQHALSLTGHGDAEGAQRTFYLQTKDAIDLATATQPHLRLGLRNAEGGAASFKVIWQSADADTPEETLLGGKLTAEHDWASHDLDLSMLAGRKGRLVIATRAADDAAPMLNDVTIYDEGLAR